MADTLPESGTDGAAPEAEIQPIGTRVLSADTSSLLRRILRMVVAGPDEERTGKRADIPGYFVGGKTGTAEKVGAGGAYLKHTNITAFTGIFPLNDPRYAVYVMLDSPIAIPETHGWYTSGWNAVPTWHDIVARIAPMMGLFPVTADVDRIEAELSIPMSPPVGAGARALGPDNDPGDPMITARAARQERQAAHAAAHAAARPAQPARGPATAGGGGAAPRRQRRQAVRVNAIAATPPLHGTVSARRPRGGHRGAAGRRAEPAGRRPRRGQPQGRGRHPVRRLPGVAARTAGAISARRWRAERRRCWRRWARSGRRASPPVPLILAAEPRQVLARLAARRAGGQPERMVAVTGTNGKTSTVEFLRQLWTLGGVSAASLGTLGVVADVPLPDTGPVLTTPDSLALATLLAAMAAGGVRAAAIEASSHGLDQFRLDGVRLAAAGFGNLTRDHLDYHGSLARYRDAKLRLFAELLPAGGLAGANADMEPDTLDRLRQIAASAASCFAPRARPARRSGCGARCRSRTARCWRSRRRDASARSASPCPAATRPTTCCWRRSWRRRSRTRCRRCCRGWSGSSACAAAWSWPPACRTGPPPMSTTRTRPTRWSGCWPRCGRTRRRAAAGWCWCSAPAATATAASGR